MNHYQIALYLTRHGESIAIMFTTHIDRSRIENLANDVLPFTNVMATHYGYLLV